MAYQKHLVRIRNECIYAFLPLCSSQVSIFGEFTEFHSLIYKEFQVSGREKYRKQAKSSDFSSKRDERLSLKIITCIREVDRIGMRERVEA